MIGRRIGSRKRGHGVSAMSAAATYTVAMERYIGFRVNRYGPRTTRVVDGLTGMMLVRDFQNVPMLQSASAAAAPARKLPVIAAIRPSAMSRMVFQRSISQPAMKKPT